MTKLRNKSISELHELLVEKKVTPLELVEDCIQGIQEDKCNAFEDATGQKVNYKIGERRAGDLPAFYANPKKANEVLGWHAERNLHDMCEDTWRFQKNNPNGYKKD